MATSIPAVTGTHIKHALLVDITVDTVTYYLTSAFNPVVYSGNTYASMGVLLGISSMSEDLKTNNGDISISLSGIPQAVIYSALQATIKGGELIVRRAFFNADNTLNSGNVYQRFSGVITNYSVSEDTDILQGRQTSTITLQAASINTILENRISGQRTHTTDRARFFGADTSFDRVKDLHNTSFDFGKPYSAPSGISGAPSQADLEAEYIRYYS